MAFCTLTVLTDDVEGMVSASPGGSRDEKTHGEIGWNIIRLEIPHCLESTMGQQIGKNRRVNNGTANISVDHICLNRKILCTYCTQYTPGSFFPVNICKQILDKIICTSTFTGTAVRHLLRLRVKPPNRKAVPSLTAGSVKSSH